jgi:hypothetical protein
MEGAWACLNLLEVAQRWSRRHASTLKVVLASEEGAEALERVEGLADCLRDVVETARRPPHPFLSPSTTMARQHAAAAEVWKS